MALSIKNDEVERVARKLTAITGERPTEATVISLEKRLDRKRAHLDKRSLWESIQPILRHYQSLPLLDPRDPDEILYDEHGLPR